MIQVKVFFDLTNKEAESSVNEWLAQVGKIEIVQVVQSATKSVTTLTIVYKK